MTDQQPRDYATPQERLAEQDWAGVAGKGIAGMAPAEKGWILAFVVIFAIFQASNYMSSIKREDGERERASNIIEYFNSIEASRSKIEEHRSEENRRLQEVIKELSQTISRQANRTGRALTADQAVENALKAQGAAHE